MTVASPGVATNAAKQAHAINALIEYRMMIPRVGTL